MVPSRQAIFLLSAGYGTRLQPVTDYLAKPLFSVKGQTLLGRHIHHLQDLKLPIFINIAYHPNAMLAYLSQFSSHVEVIFEPEPMGVAASLRRFVSLERDFDSVLLISSDLYLESYRELLSLSRQNEPFVGIDCDYAGISLIRTEDLEKEKLNNFREFFNFMKDHYKNVQIKKTYNVGTLQVANSIKV